MCIRDRYYTYLSLPKYLPAKLGKPRKYLPGNLKTYTYLSLPKYLPTKLGKPRKYLPGNLKTYTYLSLPKYLPAKPEKPRKYLPENLKTYTYLLPAMDTNDATAVKRNARATLSRLYDARVAATTEKLDPLRAKAKAALKDVDNFEVEKLDGQWGCDTVPGIPEANKEEVPLLTLRQLMPGSTGDQDEDRELDLAFKADKIEFIVVQRPLTNSEKQQGIAIEDASDVDWSIPTQEEYEDVMGLVFDVYTEKPEMVHNFSWSSVGTATGVGCFSVRTGKVADMDDIRGTIRAIVYKDKCYESFPKKAIMKSYALTAFFPRATKQMGTKKLIFWLLSCNPGLKGKILSLIHI